MKLLDQGYVQVVKIARWDNRECNQKYRLSRYCFLYEEEGLFLLRNMFTGQLYRLTREEWDIISQLNVTMQDPDYLRANMLTDLAVYQCIVPADYNEFAEYSYLVDILGIMRKKKVKGYTHYTIFPTTACNAQCAYCFENGYLIRTMDEKTARATATFIDQTKGEKMLHLAWFGGEPMLGSRYIGLICQQLKDRNISFYSSMATNGSLFTSEMAERSVKDWNLKKIQLSVDGSRDDYEKRKRYKQPALYNYDSAIQAIYELEKQGIDIRIRCNYDHENIGGLAGFVEDVGKRFGGSPYVSLYFAVLFQERDNGTAPELIRRIREIEDFADSYGLIGKKKKKKGTFPLNFCMADNLDENIVIDPEGYLYDCENLPQEHCFGNVREGITDQKLFADLKKTLEPLQECIECAFLPLCTPHRKTVCEMEKKWPCKEIRKAEMENALHRTARRIREASENEKPSNAALYDEVSEGRV